MGLGASVQAATIFVSLQTVNNPVGSNQFDVKLFARSDAAESSAGAGDGGIAGFQFDILSDGDTKSAPVPAGPTGPNFLKVKTEFAVSSSDFATQLVPQKKDVGAAELYPLDLDTDLDAYAGSFADSNSGFSNTTLGKGASGLGALIATEHWTLNGNSDHLSVFLTGPQYYNFGNTTPGAGFRSAFTSVVQDPQGGFLASSVGTTPEPASIGLIGAVAGLMLGRRRKA
jgi:hypothetical protein